MHITTCATNRASRKKSIERLLFYNITKTRLPHTCFNKTTRSYSLNNCQTNTRYESKNQTKYDKNNNDLPVLHRYPKSGKNEKKKNILIQVVIRNLGEHWNETFFFYQTKWIRTLA